MSQLNISEHRLGLKPSLLHTCLFVETSEQHRQKTLSGHVVLFGRRDVLILLMTGPLFPFGKYYVHMMVLTSTLNKMQGRMPGEFIYGIIWSHKYSNLVQQEENQTALLDTKLIFPNFYCLPEKTLSYHLLYALCKNCRDKHPNWYLKN